MQICLRFSRFFWCSEIISQQRPWDIPFLFFIVIVNIARLLHLSYMGEPFLAIFMLFFFIKKGKIIFYDF